MLQDKVKLSADRLPRSLLWLSAAAMLWQSVMEGVGFFLFSATF
jgi:hypothetical protein